MANAGKRVIERLDPDGDERETEKRGCQMVCVSGWLP